MIGDTGYEFKRLLEQLGQLLFHWCRLEQTLDEELRNLGAELPTGSTLGDRLAAWKRACGSEALGCADPAAWVAREVNRLRAVRNLVVHHLVEVSGRPGGEPFIRCEKRSGQGSKLTRVTLAELEATVEAIDQCRGCLRSVPWSRQSAG